MINKLNLLKVIVAELQDAAVRARAAAEQARETATNKENAAENRYDTLGLEAAYLAHGQSARVLKLESDAAAFRELGLEVSAAKRVGIGSLVTLEDEAGGERVVYLGPAAGGLMVRSEGVDVTIITVESPLGSALVNAAIDDEVVSNIAGKPVTFLVTGSA